MSKIKKSEIDKLKKLYYEKQLSMREIADKMQVSIDAVVYFMRKNSLIRRSASENEKIKFARKLPSYKLRRKNQKNKEVRAVGTMLYWAEGEKSGKLGKNKIVDFTNSDPKMILVFLYFLREFCGIDEKRLRCLLYCYSNQNVYKLMRYWSKITHIPISQFTKPYIRSDFRVGGRIMKYGLVHIRYSDKKLLLEIENMIESYMSKYAPIV